MLLAPDNLLMNVKEEKVFSSRKTGRYQKSFQEREMRNKELVPQRSSEQGLRLNRQHSACVCAGGVCAGGVGAGVLSTISHEFSVSEATVFQRENKHGAGLSQTQQVTPVALALGSSHGGATVNQQSHCCGIA